MRHCFERKRSAVRQSRRASWPAAAKAQNPPVACDGSGDGTVTKSVNLTRGVLLGSAMRISGRTEYQKTEFRRPIRTRIDAQYHKSIERWSQPRQTGRESVDGAESGRSRRNIAEQGRNIRKDTTTNHAGTYARVMKLVELSLDNQPLDENPQGFVQFSYASRQVPNARNESEKPCSKNSISTGRQPAGSGVITVCPEEPCVNSTSTVP